MIERNAGLPPERRIEFRIGIHLGDVVEEADGDLMGEGVNIAARLRRMELEPSASIRTIRELGYIPTLEEKMIRGARMLGLPE